MKTLPSIVFFDYIQEKKKVGTPFSHFCRRRPSQADEQGLEVDHVPRSLHGTSSSRSSTSRSLWHRCILSLVFFSENLHSLSCFFSCLPISFPLHITCFSPNVRARVAHLSFFQGETQISSPWYFLALLFGISLLILTDQYHSEPFTETPKSSAGRYFCQDSTVGRIGCSAPELYTVKSSSFCLLQNLPPITSTRHPSKTTYVLSSPVTGVNEFLPIHW